MRLIDADALYREYQEMVCNGIACHECKAVMADGTCKLDAFINNAPTIDAVSEWIPCSERLPREEKATYLVCTDSECVCSCRWTNTNPIWTNLTTEWHWCIFDIPQYSKVVAWMPLEPWKGADDE